MSKSQAEGKKAVEAGYWQLYRFNPALAEKGENPFTLDSKAPQASYQDFIRGEVRYSSLLRQFPDAADTLFHKAEKEAAKRLTTYQKLAEETVL